MEPKAVDPHHHRSHRGNAVGNAVGTPWERLCVPNPGGGKSIFWEFHCETISFSEQGVEFVSPAFSREILPQRFHPQKRLTHSKWDSISQREGLRFPGSTCCQLSRGFTVYVCSSSLEYVAVLSSNPSEHLYLLFLNHWQGFTHRCFRRTATHFKWTANLFFLRVLSRPPSICAAGILGSSLRT
jgi:hypothetical protein